MQRGYFKIIYKLLLLVLPMLLLLAFYCITDPFKVLYHYDHFYTSGKAPIVILNKDYVSTETFLHNYPRYQYDSYILGNSRAMFYEIKDWQQYIHSDKCYHFEAYKESLYGIWLKLKLLQQMQVPIRHVLLVIDTSVLEATGDTYHEANLYMKDPQLSGSNKLMFQYQFVKAFFDIRFLSAYTGYRISGKVLPYMRKLDVFDEKVTLYNDTTNEIVWAQTDSLLHTDAEVYYKEHVYLFREEARTERESQSVIGGTQMKMLTDIRNILAKQQTEYKIIINPHYLQASINHQDIAYLQNLFGAANVYNFSGKNAITEDKHNFYDMGHYRPETARYIMSVVYGSK